MRIDRNQVEKKQYLTTNLLWATMAVVILVGISASLGLFATWPYVNETTNWKLQAQGQDIGNLLSVLILGLSAVAARRGSIWGFQIWVGIQFYICYAMAIYAFAVHFGPLFLVYVASLGLSLYSLGFALSVVSFDRVAKTKRGPRWLVAFIAVGFTVLWLSSIVPALASSTVPEDLVAAGLVSNPVQVLDLAIVLPALGFVALYASRGKGLANFLVPSCLVFSAVMATSIVAGMILLRETVPVAIGLALLALVSGWEAYTARYLGVVPRQQVSVAF